MSPQRAEDALRVARGLGLVVANAASQSRFLKLLQKDVVAAVQAAAQHAAQHASQHQTSSKCGPHSSTAAHTHLNTSNQDFTTPAPSPGRPVNVMYGYTAVQGSQLLFSTHATQRPVFSIPAPLKPLLDPDMPPLDVVAPSSAVQKPEMAVPAESETQTFNTEAHRPVQPEVSARGLASAPQVEVTAQKVINTSPPAIEKMEQEASTTDTQPIPPAVTIQKRKFRERAVPSSRIGRAMGFAGLGAGLVWGATTDAVSRALGPASDEPRGVLSEANAQRLANALCRMRGAALKIGQMLSIQDEDMVPPAVSAALEQVRQQADVMPRHQLQATLVAQLGADWESKVASFEWEPAAAASIGQVHRAVLHDGRAVAMKIQYPGVADSIESDIDNLVNLLAVFNVAPRGLFLEEVTDVAKKELALECDYRYEAASQKKFRELLQAAPPELRDCFQVPEVVGDLSSERVLCSTWVQGVPIDKVKDMSQGVRDRVGTALLRLTLQELFVWRFMQTDPNWGNFLYDEATGMMSLIDFGAARSFPKTFVDNYIRMVRACALQDRATQLEASRDLGFLTGQEIPEMEEAHVQAGSLVGTPFGTEGMYDFGSHNQLTKRVAVHSATMLRHRLKAPPPEVYSLHRRLAGAFLVNMKLRAKVPCQQLFNGVYDSYNFGPDESESLDSDQ